MSEKFVHVIKEDDGTRDFPKHKIQYHGKPVDAIGWYGYGVFGNPDDCMARLERVGGNEQRVVWPDDPKNRPEAAKNESGIYNPTTGAKIHFKANGDLEVTTTSGNVIVNATENVALNATKSVVMTAIENVSVNATGNVVMDGALLEGNFGGEELIAIISELALAVREMKINHDGTRSATTTFKSSMDLLIARIDGMGT